MIDHGQKFGECILLPSIDKTAHENYLQQVHLDGWDHLRPVLFLHSHLCRQFSAAAEKLGKMCFLEHMFGESIQTVNETIQEKILIYIYEFIFLVVSNSNRINTI